MICATHSGFKCATHSGMKCPTPQNPQNYFYHYYFSHFLPLHLNSERKSGKDLEILPKSFIFAARM